MPQTELPATRSASSSQVPGETPRKLHLRLLRGWRSAAPRRHTPRESCACRVRRTAQGRAWRLRSVAARPPLCSAPSPGSPHNALTKINRREGKKVTEGKTVQCDSRSVRPTGLKGQCWRKHSRLADRAGPDSALRYFVRLKAG